MCIRDRWISWYDFLGTKTEEEKFEDFLQDFIYLAEKRDNKEIPFFPSDDLIGPRGVKIGQIWRSLIYWKGEDPLKKKIQIKQRLNGICVLETRDDWIREEKIKIYKEWVTNRANPFPPKGLKIKGFDIYEWFKVANGKMKNLKKGSRNVGMQLRNDYKGVEEASKLEALGFPFIDKKRYIWDIKFKELEEIIHSHKGIPVKINENKKNNTWVDSCGNEIKFRFDETPMRGWYMKNIVCSNENWSEYPERKEPTLNLRTIIEKYLE